MFEVTCLLDLYLLVFSQLDLKGAISLMSHNSRQHSPRVTLRTETVLALSRSSHLYSEEQTLRLTEDRCREPPHKASSSGRESSSTPPACSFSRTLRQACPLPCLNQECGSKCKRVLPLLLLVTSLADRRVFSK